MNFSSLLKVGEQDCWLKQVVATVNKVNYTTQMINKFFGGCIISLNLWPPLSLDLLPPDFYLWAFERRNV
jgi:hypothetical protein